MATFSLTITLGNDAMQTPANIAEALAVLAGNIYQNTAGDPYEPVELGPNTRINGNVFDTNGNLVGEWKIR